jgi:hypothetical protein
MTFHLRLLHISEVPADGRERPAAWDWQQAGGDAWLRHLDPLRDDSGIDLVCVTGRAAGRGLDSQQSRATGFLATTLDQLGLGWERLFLVPSCNPAAPRPADGRPTEPGCRRELRLAHLPFGVQVISLDAAWLSSGAGARRPWLTMAAVERLASGPFGEPLPGFRLGLLQQRLTGLDVVPATARRLAERVDLLLSGDAQAVEVAGAEAWLTAGSAPRPRRRSRRAGQLQDGRRRYPRGDYQPPVVSQLITVTCDAAGRPCRVILRLRSAPPAVTMRSRAVPSGAATGLRAFPAARYVAANDLGDGDAANDAAAAPDPKADCRDAGVDGGTAATRGGLPPSWPVPAPMPESHPWPRPLPPSEAAPKPLPWPRAVPGRQLPPPADAIVAFRLDLAVRLLDRGEPADRQEALCLLKQALTEAAAATTSFDSGVADRIRALARRYSLDSPP